MGYEVGTKILDVNYMREKGYKREVNLQKMLLFIKSNVWKVRSDQIIIVLSLLRAYGGFYFPVEFVWQGGGQLEFR